MTEARRLIAGATHPVALVSSWGSNEELAAFASLLAPRFTVCLKPDLQPAAGEPLEDALLIRADKNPNTAGARALFGDAGAELTEDTDLVLVWGEGFDFARVPRHAKTVYLNAWLDPANGWADAFFATSLQTERRGHYTNFEGRTGAFEPCFPKSEAVVDAEALFAAIAGGLSA
jgi:NADH-quinone oxidoreductase subunit G